MEATNSTCLVCGMPYAPNSKFCSACDKPPRQLVKTKKVAYGAAVCFGITCFLMLYMVLSTIEIHSPSAIMFVFLPLVALNAVITWRVYRLSLPWTVVGLCYMFFLLFVALNTPIIALAFVVWIVWILGVMFATILVIRELIVLRRVDKESAFTQ